MATPATIVSAEEHERIAQADGTYVETTVHGGTVSPVAFPHVTVDLDALFA